MIDKVIIPRWKAQHPTSLLRRTEYTMNRIRSEMLFVGWLWKGELYCYSPRPFRQLWAIFLFLKSEGRILWLQRASPVWECDPNSNTNVRWVVAIAILAPISHLNSIAHCRQRVVTQGPPYGAWRPWRSLRIRRWRVQNELTTRIVSKVDRGKLSATVAASNLLGSYQ